MLVGQLWREIRAGRMLGYSISEGFAVPPCSAFYLRPRRGSLASLGLAGVILAAPTLCFSTHPSAAATVNVPPVTITQLSHSLSDGHVFDAITIPGPGHTSGGFTAAISAGDVVTIRFQAPAGKKFVVHAPAGVSTEYFFFNTYWSAGGDVTSVAPHTVAFENFHGIAPTETYSRFALGDNGAFVQAWRDYVVNGPFEFTAIQVNMTASQPLIPMSRTFSDVRSFSEPSWGASAWSGPDTSLMEIVDVGVVGTRKSSWGLLKSLYR